MAVNSLSDTIIERILSSGYECENLDFKEVVDFSNRRSLLDLAKDLIAMANTRGGHIVVGVSDDGRRIGVPHTLTTDPAVLADKVNAFCSPRLKLYYREYFKTIGSARLKFLIIYVERSETPIVIARDGNYQYRGKTLQVFRRGDIIVRKGAKSERADEEDVRRLVEEAVLRPERMIRSARLMQVFRAAVSPDRVTEELVGNLFPIEEYPEFVWSGATNIRRKEEALEILGEDRKYAPSFILRAKRLYTFSNLSRGGYTLRPLLLNNEFERERVDSWRDDLNKWRWFIELMNIVLRRHCQRLDLIFHPEISAFYFPAERGETKLVWQPSRRRRKATRIVTKCSGYQDGTPRNCVHQAFKMRICTLGGNLYLQVNPCYAFTKDGKMNLIEPEKRARRHIQYEYRKRNPDILYSTFFWIDILSSFQSQIVVKEEGAPLIRISKIPVKGKINVGIAQDRRSLSIRSRINVYQTLDPFLIS